ncbi:HAD hydrolase family protein [Ruminococcus flavefaciens]|uniref:HAD hydrolase family protein n=1 Tax=Ruminococcus flavefaciens TaxID=1265 RepID=UPI0004B596E0|nr:HAD hydrolase family protein [Ruminococcus flavefaciens]
MDKKTIYLSDLDGTLLNSEQKTSDFTNNVINKLVNDGMIFSYATARSWNTASKVTNGISVALPAIVYNGAFIIDTLSGERLISNYFDEKVNELIEELTECDIQPTVYSVQSGDEKFSYIPDKITKGMTDFVESRREDSRNNPVVSETELFIGDIFYITCIDETEKLQPFYDKYKEMYHCVFQRDIYSDEQWLEIMPFKASKSRAALQLKEYLGCEWLVVFGDALKL